MAPRPAPLANEHVAGNRRSGGQARCARGSSRAGSRGSDQPITIPVSLPIAKPKNSNPCAEVVAWFEDSVVVGGVVFSPMKDWIVEAIAAAQCHAEWPAGGIRDKFDGSRLNSEIGFS